MLCQGLSPQIASSLFVRRSGWLHSVCFPCFFAEIICRISLIPVSPTASWRRALGTRDNERLRRAYGRREATASRPSSCLSASPRSKEMTPEDCRYTSEISNFCYFFFFIFLLHLVSHTCGSLWVRKISSQTEAWPKELLKQLIPQKLELLLANFSFCLVIACCLVCKCSFSATC